MRNNSELLPDEQQRLKALYALGLLDTRPETAYDRVVRLVARHFDVPFAALALVDASRVWLKAAQGNVVVEYGRDGSVCSAVLKQGDLLVVEGNTAARCEESAAVATTAPLRFLAACALQPGEGQRVGALWIADTRLQKLDGARQQALRDFAAIVSEMLNVLQRSAQDPLTGMANRRGFLLMARQNLAFCSRQGCPATLLLLDVAGLKTINDRYGRDEGDLALLALADILAKTFRGSDSVARLEGDRFAVFLSNVKAVQASLLFNRIVNLLDRYNRQVERGYDLGCNSTLAEFSVSRHGSLERLLEEAEAEMQLLKSSRVGGATADGSNTQ